MGDLIDSYRDWLNRAVERELRQRDEKWTESIAVGNRSFVEITKERLGIRAKVDP